MKKFIILIIALYITGKAGAQQTIPMTALNAHVGDSVTVCTKIYGGVYLEHSKGTPTLLNAGDSYPNNPLTILIWPDVRGLFKESPEFFYKDKEVCITGKIILYKEKPEIIIYNPAQIVLKPVSE